MYGGSCGNLRAETARARFGAIEIEGDTGTNTNGVYQCLRELLIGKFVWARFRSSMSGNSSKLIILVAEDDENDAFMLKRAFEKNGIAMPVHICPDGDAAMAYLQGQGQFADRDAYPFPRIFITDLKMPGRSGFEILEWLQSHPECNLIPKIVLSASNLEPDVIRAYQLGANCYFTKPSTTADLKKMVQMIHEFWTMADLPPLPANC